MALKMKPAIQEKAKEQQARKPKSVPMNSSEQKPVDTRREVAWIAKVSEDTVRKTEAVLNEAPESVKAEMLAGTKSVKLSSRRLSRRGRSAAVRSLTQLNLRATSQRRRPARPQRF